MFQVSPVPSSIVTPVSCSFHVLCSTHTPVFVLSDPLHVICSTQTIKFPVSCMFPQSEYQLCLVLYSLLDPPLELCLNSALYSRIITSDPALPDLSIRGSEIPRNVRNPWTAIEGRCSARAEANIQTQRP